MTKRVLIGCVAVVACALAIAACGSSGSSGKVKATKVSYAQSLKFSNCMRAHGVPNFPDPQAGGGLKVVQGSGLNPFSPSFRAAQKACSRYAPGGGRVPKMSASQRRAALKFAQCVRTHGDSNFPDPALSVQPGTPVIALRGMFFPVGQGFDPQAPAFKQAAAACGFRPPPGAP
jgi:hypothetical protein